MKEQEKNKKIIFAVLLILISVIILLGIKSITSNLTINAEFQTEKLKREKQALTEQIKYLDQILKYHSLSYSLIYDGTEDNLRRIVSFDEADRLDYKIFSHEVSEIFSTLDGHVNESVNFIIKGNDYLLVVHKDLIGGEVRYHVKYVLENSNSIDIYFEHEVLPFTVIGNKESRLIYHWVKVLKIPCETHSERNVVFHILK